METHGASQRLTCRVVAISRSVYRHEPDKQRDETVIAALQAAVEQYQAYVFSTLFKILRPQSHRWYHKRVYRVYCAKSRQATTWQAAHAESPSGVSGRPWNGDSVLVDGFYERQPFLRQTLQDLQRRG